MENSKKIKGSLSLILLVVFVMTLCPSKTFAEDSAIYYIDYVYCSGYTNQLYKLDSTVSAYMTDGTYQMVPVDWEQKTINIPKPGSYYITGTVTGYNSPVTMYITITERPGIPSPTPVVTQTPVVTPTPSVTQTPSKPSVLWGISGKEITPGANFDTIKPRISTMAEYDRNLYLAFKNQMDEVQFIIDGYDINKFNYDRLNKMLEIDPTLDYGYKTLDTSVKNAPDRIGVIFHIKFSYSIPFEERKMMKKMAEEKSTAILKKIIKPKMTDLQKEKAIHDYVIKNTVYDYENYKKNTIPTVDYLDYGVLVKGTGVCAGYAKAMYRLLNQAGIPCDYVVGKITYDGKTFMDHAWNRVKIKGKIYNLDATWDDPNFMDGSSGISYDYFNKSDKQFSKDHQWENER